MAGSGLGLRTERVRIYRRCDAGSDGFPRPVYQFVAERWGRVALQAATFRLGSTPQAAFDTRYDALATFADEVDLPADGLLLAGEVAYFIRGTVRSVLLRRQTVRLERVSVDEYARTVLYPDACTRDGTYIVDPDPNPAPGPTPVPVAVNAFAPAFDLSAFS